MDYLQECKEKTVDDFILDHSEIIALLRNKEALLKVMREIPLPPAERLVYSKTPSSLALEYWSPVEADIPIIVEK